MSLRGGVRQRLGPGTKRRPRVGYSYLHVAIDDRSRLALRRGPRQRDRRHAIAHTFTRPYRPQTNNKAERFNRTLSDEFLYNHKFKSEPDRRRRLQTWVHHYNLHRHHTAIAGTPASRVNNLYGHYN